MKTKHTKRIVQPDTRNGPPARGMPGNKAKTKAKAEEKAQAKAKAEICRHYTALPISGLQLVWHNSVKYNCYTGPPGRNGPVHKIKTGLWCTGKIRWEAIGRTG